jgi:hypothetical protein
MDAARTQSKQAQVPLGTAVQSTVTLTIHYDYGLVRTFTGTLSDANHLTGTFDDSSATVVFTRR